MEFRLLGPVEVVDGSEPLALGGARPRRLLALLLLTPNEVVSVDRLIEGIWEESPPASAPGAVQVHVHALRKALGADRIVTRDPGYLLRIDGDELDVARFERLASEGRRELAAGGAEHAARLLGEALSIWRGDVLADQRYATFAQPQIQRLEDARLAVLEARIEADLQLGRQSDLVGELEALVAEHPLRERLRAQLMLALYRSGRQADALAAYQDARSALVDALGIDPSPELRELERAILRQDASLDHAASPAARGSQLPVTPTALLGRELELAAVGALLGRPEIRLVTLTGTGGSGKTRLALGAAQEIGNAVFVDLAPIADATLVLPTVAGALGLEESAQRSALDQLADALREAPPLLLLDNLEHLPEAFPLVGELLKSAPALRVLATSRVPLRIVPESEYRVDPLSVPEPGVERTADIAAFPAVQLYVERATHVLPSFALTDENAPAVARICRALDGLPLAVELAAARVRALGPAGTASRLGERLALLTRRAPDLPERQRSLRATIDWSYQLLDADSQHVFRALGVFAGGAPLGGVEAVADNGVDVATAIETLLDAGVATVDSTGTHEPRFGMLETIREYALEALAASDEEARAVPARHFGWCLRVAEGDDPRYWTRGTAWLREVAPEHDNMRAALAYAEAHGDVEGRLRLVCALSEFLRNHGHVVEATRLLEEAVADAPSVNDTVHARVLAEAGMVILLTPQRDRAEALLLEALDRFEALGNAIETGRTQMRLGILASQRGAFEDSLGWASRAHDSLAGEDTYLAALSLAHVGYAHLALGELAQARSQSSEAFAVFEVLGDDRGISIAGSVLSDVLLTDRDLEGAGRAIQMLVESSVRLDSPEWIAYGLQFAADLALLLDRPRDASALIAAFERELAARGVIPDDGRRRYASIRSRLRGEYELDPAAEPSIPIASAVELALDVTSQARAAYSPEGTGSRGPGGPDDSATR